MGETRAHKGKSATAKTEVRAGNSQPARQPGRPGPLRGLLNLQRSLGNLAVGALLQSSSEPLRAVTPAAARITRRPGDPLSPPVRAHMEAAFGHRFGDVRVHTDAAAAESASELGAYAFAAGNHVAFAAGRYRPDEPAGQALLAHELAHVVQHGRDSARLGLLVPPPAPPIVVSPAPPPQVRYAPNPYERGGSTAEPTEPPDLDKELADERERLADALQRGALPSGPPPPQTSQSWLEKELFGTGKPPWATRAVLELERPVATLARGGTAPAFVEVGPPVAVTIHSQALTVRPRVLHVLDAIEYEVGLARTERDLDRVLRRYLGRSPLRLRPPIFLPYTEELETHLGPVFPADLDPDLSVRRAIYVAAVRARVKEEPELATAPSARGPTAEIEEEEKPRRRPACEAAWVPRPEGNEYQLRHNQFAAAMVARFHIPGASPELDYSVSLGGARSTDYDSYDFLSRTYYEFKTRHEYVPFDRLSQTWMAMSRIVPQAQDQADTMAKCDPGGQLVWVFDNDAVADAVRPLIAPFVDAVFAVRWDPETMP